MTLSGDPMIFLQRPISAAMLAIARLQWSPRASRSPATRDMAFAE